MRTSRAPASTKRLSIAARPCGSLLVRDRALDLDDAHGCFERQIAVIVDRQLRSAVDTQQNRRRIGSRRNDEVVFERAPVAMEHRVHAGIDAGHDDAAECRHVDMRPAGCAAEAMDARVLRIGARDGRTCVEIDEPQFERGGDRRVARPRTQR